MICSQTITLKYNLFIHYESDLKFIKTNINKVNIKIKEKNKERYTDTAL